MGKNLVSLDIETTGLDKNYDHVIQIAMVKFDYDTFDIIDQRNYYVRPEGNYTISVSAWLKHKITTDFLKDKPTLRELAPEILNFIKGCALLIYNGISFDIPFLSAELHSVGYELDINDYECYDAFLEEKRRHGMSLEKTYERYTGKKLSDSGLMAHDALGDVMATIEIFKHQRQDHDYEPEKTYGNDGFITEVQLDEKVVPGFAVGKYKGVPISYVGKLDEGYINWILTNDKFSQTTKNIVKQYI